MLRTSEPAHLLSLLLVQVWQLPDGSAGFSDHAAHPKRLAQMAEHADAVNAVAVTADGRWLLSASEDGTICVWDLRSHTLKATLTGHDGGVTGVAVHGTTAVSCSGDGSVRIWDLGNFSCTDALDDLSQDISHVVINPQGVCAVSDGSHAWVSGVLEALRRRKDQQHSISNQTRS